MTMLIATPTINLAPSSDSGVIGDDITNVTKPTFSGTGVPGTNVQVRIDGKLVGSALVSAKGLWSFTSSVPLSSGKHTITASDVNASGATSAPSSLALVIDTSSSTPTIGLTAASDSGVIGDDITKVTKPTFTGVAAAGATVKVLIDGKLAGTALANKVGQWSFTPTTALASGTHTITATAVDVAGNISTAASLALVIDTLSPTPTIQLAAASDSGVVGDDITNVTKPTLTGVAAAGATVKILIDGKSAGTAVANKSGQWSFTPTTAVTSGTHTITATAVDVAGNTSAVASLALVIDTASVPMPTIQLAAASDSGMVGDDITNVTDPTFTGKAPAGDTIKVLIDGKSAGTAVANAAGLWSFTPPAAIASANHTVTATAVDIAGNTSAVASLALVIDTSSPTPTIQLAAGSDSGVVGDDITNVPDPTFTGVAEDGSIVTIAVDGKTDGTALANATGAWSFSPGSALADGSHIVTSTAVDVAGNTSTAATLDLQIVAAVPTPTIGLATGSEIGTASNGTISIADPIFTGVAEDNSTVTVQIDGKTVGTAVASATGIWTFTPPAALVGGSHTVTATSDDAAGDVSAAGSLSLQVSNDAPPSSGSGGTTPPVTPPPVTPPPVIPPLPSGSLVAAPVIPQPTAAGDIVGLVLQNNQSSVLAAREITFGQEFAAGQVMPGTQMVADINGTLVPVQMDVKTTNPDGSVAMAVLTMQQPALAANSSVNVMLQSGTYAVAPAISLTSLTGGSYNFIVDLTLHNADGTTTPFAINVGQALAAALKAGTESYWLQGPQATQARIDVPISGSLHLTFDITAYADGTTSTDVQFNNDLAMTASGGTVTYDATISQNGTVEFSQSNITEHQYQTWDQEIYSNGTPQVNIQHDIAALEATGDIQNYDLSTGVAALVINQEAKSMSGPGFGVLGNANILEYMPETGSRGDIGTTTQGNAAWLITQNQTAEEYALAQANAAGSVPWHFFDPVTGTYLNVANNPKLWTASNSVQLGYTALTQPMPTPAQSGWTPDSAHEPDLDYVAYLMTGNRYYLDQLNAEAAYDVISTAPNGRHDGQGIVADGTDQVRAQAWNLREIVEAASANPVGSTEKTYFTNIMNANFTFLLSETTTANQGQASGWIPGNANGSGEQAPWQQDYFATTVVLAAEQGVAAATQLLLWETNFLAGRFLDMDPYLGIGYRLNTYVAGASESDAYQTWAQIETSTLASGDATNVLANGSGWTNNDGYYASLARASLAGDITVTASPQAIDAYGWITAYAPQAGTAWQQLNPEFNIAPRLPDGQLLTSNNIIVSANTIAANIHGTNADQLIYETGSGNVTITGGTGMNILFAGSGSDKLVGGPNNDYLFGGSGSDIMSAGAGTNYMQPGTGAATVLLAATDSAHDLIADFKVGIDHLAVTDLAGNAATASEINAMIAGTTVNASGSALLHLSGFHDVTLQGISASQVTTGLFS